MQNEWLHVSLELGSIDLQSSEKKQRDNAES
jgi:hypothetical protein